VQIQTLNTNALNLQRSWGKLQLKPVWHTHITPRTYQLNALVVVESLWCNSWGRMIFGRPDGHFTLLIHKGLFSSLSSYRQNLSAKWLFKDHWHRSRESNTYMPPDVTHLSCNVTASVRYIHVVTLFGILTWHAFYFNSISGKFH